MSEKQPNIVFFYWDNFGWGELGCYGREADHTVTDKTVGALATPEAARLQLRFNPVGHGALLEV